MPASDDQPKARMSGRLARNLRVRLLQELEKAGLIRYNALVPDAEPSSYKGGSGFLIEAGGVERTLIGNQVEAYVDGMLDALRVLGKLGEDLDKVTGEILGRG
jgi:hypothetical protein